MRQREEVPVRSAVPSAATTTMHNATTTTANLATAGPAPNTDIRLLRGRRGSQTGSAATSATGKGLRGQVRHTSTLGLQRQAGKRPLGSRRAPCDATGGPEWKPVVILELQQMRRLHCNGSRRRRPSTTSSVGASQRHSRMHCWAAGVPSHAESMGPGLGWALLAWVARWAVRLVSDRSDRPGQQKCFPFSAHLRQKWVHGAGRRQAPKISRAGMGEGGDGPLQAEANSSSRRSLLVYLINSGCGSLGIACRARANRWARRQARRGLGVKIGIEPPNMVWLLFLVPSKPENETRERVRNFLLVHPIPVLPRA